MLFRSDRKSTRLNSSHTIISYAVFCLKKKNVASLGSPVRDVRRAAGAEDATRRGAATARRRQPIGAPVAKPSGLLTLPFFFKRHPDPPNSPPSPTSPPSS